MVHGLLYALPGTPVMWYGDEIGMGELLDLDERNPVRTPMQWADEPQAGFSTNPDTVRPPAEDGPTGYHRTNVAAQRADPGSLLHKLREMIRVRRACPEIGWGETTILDAPDGILALRCDWKGGSVVTLHDLSGKGGTAELDLGDTPVTLLSSGGEGLDLEPFGYRWFRLGGERR
jgi:maltose alpha-D-glucosyltransferase/alpha-amylase